jgi:hypothetical protein
MVVKLHAVLRATLLLLPSRERAAWPAELKPATAFVVACRVFVIEDLLFFLHNKGYTGIFTIFFV